MTDLTPNDLSHLSDAEFNALCPQGEHAPGPEPLSPDAQAILAAWCAAHGWEGEDIPPAVFHGLGAALRVAAKSVGPSEILPHGYAYSAPAEQWHYEFKLQAEGKLLAIATELENANV